MRNKEDEVKKTVEKAESIASKIIPKFSGLNSENFNKIYFSIIKKCHYPLEAIRNKRKKEN